MIRMRPSLQVLPTDTIPQIIEEAMQLLRSPGIKVGSRKAIDLLYSSGAEVDESSGIVQIPEELVLESLRTVPKEFSLYNRQGDPVVQYAKDLVHFDPGSSGVHVLDSETLEHRPSMSSDLVQIIQLADQMPEFDAQSTAVICHDVPEEIGDFYRLYIVLLFSEKPIVTGAFSTDTSQVMFDLLNISAASPKDVSNKPRAIFDVCPSPPLNWTEFASQNLVDLARLKIPAQIVSMPLPGAAAPITLIGSIVQHAAECLSGIVIHQLANPGAPIVWGGAPAQFDMRYGTTSVGAAETSLIISGYAQVGKYLGLPTHAYLVATDSKAIDTQAGLESGVTALIGTLSGINMISGPGMLDFLASFSLEKMIIDAEAIAAARRYAQGIKLDDSISNLDHYEDFTFPGNFLTKKLTRNLFRDEHYMPSEVIDRGSLREWSEKGNLNSFDRAKLRVQQLTSSYQRPEIPKEIEEELNLYVSTLAAKAGLDQLPKLY